MAPVGAWSHWKGLGAYRSGIWPWFGESGQASLYARGCILEQPAYGTVTVCGVVAALVPQALVAVTLNV